MQPSIDAREFQAFCGSIKFGSTGQNVPIDNIHIHYEKVVIRAPSSIKTTNLELMK